MKFDTVLNAMMIAHKNYITNLKYFNSSEEIKHSKYYRQYHAFRADVRGEGE
jgi:hypothetical protein